MEIAEGKRTQLCADAEYQVEVEPLRFTSELLKKYIFKIIVNGKEDVEIEMIEKTGIEKH